MRRLGVNIDHVATIRNARGNNHPDPLFAAKLAMKYGADSITIHLREDRRHIKDLDVKILCKNKNIPINLEIGSNENILKIALKYKPNYVCIVPEKRKEITTEGGLNLSRNKNKIKRMISKLNKNKIRTTLFINANTKNILLAKKLNSDCVELHTGKLTDLIKSKKNYLNELNKIKLSSKLARSIGLEVHAGHGIDFNSIKILNKINEIEEFNIGHFIIGQSIFDGFKMVIKKFIKLSNN
jgi:pyridoxine 5-phosphate synthase